MEAGDAGVRLSHHVRKPVEELIGLELTGQQTGEHARLAQPREHVLEMRAIPDEPRRQVRHHGVAGAREPLVQVERRVEPLRGEAVTVTLTPVERCSRTWSSMPSSGRISKRARWSS
jgi:hypothetical protein